MPEILLELELHHDPYSLYHDPSQPNRAMPPMSFLVPGFVLAFSYLT